ncbi:CD209 antigen-like [Elysia marginata]|uniref:CD209 antigen-like n=1 Tax=Elysia marginata TaxID=1093978 RepID=A0AAV4ET38_9GAST|nr:CD209 antigen-like [Elysia marginata]
MALKLWIFFSLHGLCVYCEIKVSTLKKATGLDCQTLPLGEAWTSPSPAECFIKCSVRFPNLCQSVVYNDVTKNCVPGSVAFGPLETLDTSIPKLGSGDSIYYAKQPVPSCNTAGPFNLYEVCGVTACLYLSPIRATYQNALAACSSMNSNIFLGNTAARFSVFWYISLNHNPDNTWFTVKDTAREGTFVWENGDPVTVEQSRMIWRPGYPNAWSADEDCTEARHKDWPGIYGLNDEECYNQKRYMCEPNDSYFSW